MYMYSIVCTHVLTTVHAHVCTCKCIIHVHTTCTSLLCTCTCIIHSRCTVYITGMYIQCILQVL